MQPSTSAGNLFNAVLLIEGSQSVTVDGINIQAETTNSIGIDHGSRDIRLRNLTAQGGGIAIAENSQVSLAYVTGQTMGGYTPLAIYDLSDVHIEHSVFEDTSSGGGGAGMDVESSHAVIYDTTIRNMAVGINEGTGSIVDVSAFSTYYPISGSPHQVTITSSPGISYEGASLTGRSALNVIGNNAQATKLMIEQPGQAYGGTTGGVLVSDGSVLEANSNLVITGSRGQGIVVVNNSHATLNGVTVTGSGHGGVVASNLSSIDLAAGSTPSMISGNGVDVFCDSDSGITGSTNATGVRTIQCSNLLPAEFTLP